MENKIKWLKEIVVSLIGIALVAVALLIALQTFGDRKERPVEIVGADGTVVERIDGFQRGKDILLLLLPLAGSIVGYYTGRVVADRAIDQSVAAAEKAEKVLDEVVAEGSRVVDDEILPILTSEAFAPEGIPSKDSIRGARDAALKLVRIFSRNRRVYNRG